MGSIDTDNIEILTPLKHKIEKKEKEVLHLAMRIDELENENRTLCDMIKTNEPIASISQNNVESYMDKIKELEQKTTEFRKEIKSLTYRLKTILKRYTNLNKKIKDLQNRGTSLSTIRQSIKNLRRDTDKLKDLIDKTPLP